jgi:hypothetical protein
MSRCPWRLPGCTTGAEGVEADRTEPAGTPSGRKDCNVVTIQEIDPYTPTTYVDEPQTSARGDGRLGSRPVIADRRLLATPVDEPGSPARRSGRPDPSRGHVGPEAGRNG